MRSREPWRLPAGQSRAVPFLQAAVLFAALCIFARSAALVLAAFLAAPVPAAQTLLHLGQQAVESRAAAVSAESVPEAVSAPSPAQETAAPEKPAPVPKDQPRTDAPRRDRPKKERPPQQDRPERKPAPQKQERPEKAEAADGLSKPRRRRRRSGGPRKPSGEGQPPKAE